MKNSKKFQINFWFVLGGIFFFVLTFFLINNIFLALLSAILCYVCFKKSIKGNNEKDTNNDKVDLILEAQVEEELPNIETNIKVEKANILSQNPNSIKDKNITNRANSKDINSNLTKWEVVSPKQKFKKTFNSKNPLNTFDLTSYYNKYSVKNIELYEKIGFLNNCSGRKVKDIENMFFYKSEPNPQSLYKELIDQEYLVLPNNHEKLEKLIIPDLKDILRNNNLKVSGRKNELIDRIINNIPEKELTKILENNDKFYVLSKKGENLIENNSGIIYLNNQSYLDITKNDLIQLREALGNNASFGEMMNSYFHYILETHKDSYWKQFDFREVIIEILLEQEKYDKALLQLLFINYLNICENYKHGAKELTQDHYTNKLRNLKKYYNEDMLLDFPEDQYISLESYKEMLVNIFKGNEIYNKTPGYYPELDLTFK